MSDSGDSGLTFARDRVTTFLSRLAVLVSGDTRGALPISPLDDELDAIAHGVNVLVGELRWAHALRLELDCMQQSLTPGQRRALSRLSELLESNLQAGGELPAALRDACAALGIEPVTRDHS